jgi:hypothetical protein
MGPGVRSRKSKLEGSTNVDETDQDRLRQPELFMPRSEEPKHIRLYQRRERLES